MFAAAIVCITSMSTTWKECGQAECWNLKFELLWGFGASHEAMTRASPGGIYNWQLTWNWSLTFNILVRSRSNRLRNLPTVEPSVRKHHVIIFKSVTLESSSILVRLGSYSKTWNPPFKPQRGSSDQKEEGKEEEFGWFKVGRSIIISMESGMLQSKWGTRAQEMTHNNHSILQSVYPQKITRESSHAYHLFGSVTASPSSKLGFELYGCFNFNHMIEPGRATLQEEFQVLSVDNDDLALWKSPRLQNSRCIQTPKQIRVRKGFVDALESCGLRMYVCACFNTPSVIRLMDGCVIQSRPSFLLSTSQTLIFKYESTSVWKVAWNCNY